MSTVLVVDDNADNQYYLEKLLSANGYRVVTAEHGEEALQQAGISPPDLVISDLLMPVMDGYTLLRHWKEHQMLATVPFIVYTATYTEPEDEQLALELGADAFLVKPAEPEVMLELLRDVTSRAPANPANPANPTDTRRPVVPDENPNLFVRYSRSLVRKLEEKTLALDQANRQLQEDLLRRADMEERLRRSEERFRLLARATNDAIWDWDIVSDTRWWGMGFANLFGYEHGEILPNEESWTRLVHPDDRDEVTRQLDIALAGQDESWAAAYRLRKDDGQWSRVEDRGYILRDDQGKAIRMIGGLTDVSERVALEERIRKSQRLEAVGQLTGGMAHDFNNLLTVVLGNAETLTDQLNETPRLRELAAIIVSAAERGSDLTRRLLAFSRKQSLSPRAVELRDLLDNMLPLLQQALGGNITIALAAGTTSQPEALIDPTQLENAVLNLCVNARDAMPDGGQLMIDLEEKDLREDIIEQGMPVTAGHYVRLSVSDTGTGMDSATRKQIFEPFFSTKTEGKGSGLGLAMVHGFVHQSGGHITLESEPGRGSTFHLYLPVATADSQKAADGSNAPGDMNGDGVSRGNGETILLVEDDPLVRQFAAGLLQSLDYRVMEASDASTALSILESTPSIDLLFTDVVMPGGSGRALAEQASRLRPDLPIVLTSGYTNPDSNEETEECKSIVSRYPTLDKPYRRQTLARFLRAALECTRTPPPDYNTSLTNHSNH
ncbi:MAG: response regulator [Pseudohongiellaceae bacterium]